MRYVITYDIRGDPIRERIAEIVEGYGVRVQRSVFECRLDDDALEQLVRRLRGALGSPKHGNIRVYRQCERCERASVGLGEVERPEDEPMLFV